MARADRREGRRVRCLTAAPLEPPMRPMRQSHMRAAPAILFTALMASTLLPMGEQRAAASCAGPHLVHTDRLTLQGGTTGEIEGAAYADGCRDTGSCSSTLGCTTCDYGPDPT